MDAVDAALDELHHTSPVYNRGRFANHSPMVVETLGHLGHADDVPSWWSARRDWYGPPPPRRSAIGGEWQQALGDLTRYADWQDHFARELRHEPWSDVVRRWAARLAPGFRGHLFHGVIRVAHAVRGLTAADTASRRTELADALAYWASVYEPVGDGEAVPFADPASGAHAVVRRSTVRYLIDGHRYPILFLHGVTGAAAAARLVPHLDEATGGLLVRWADQGVRWVESNGTDQSAWEGDDAMPPDEIVVKAVANGDEHAIKLADACLEAYAADPDPLFLSAAADGIARF
jgi:hypothetical protein